MYYNNNIEIDNKLVNVYNDPEDRKNPKELRPLW